MIYQMISSIMTWDKRLGVTDKNIKESLKESGKYGMSLEGFLKDYTALEAMDYVLEGKLPEKQVEDINITIGLMGYVL